MDGERVIRLEAFVAQLAIVGEHAGEMDGLHVVAHVTAPRAGKGGAQLAEKGTDPVVATSHMLHQLLVT